MLLSLDFAQRKMNRKGVNSLNSTKLPCNTYIHMMWEKEFMSRAVFIIHEEEHLQKLNI